MANRATTYRERENRHKLYRNSGFAEICDASQDNSRIAVELCAILCTVHGLNLRPCFVRKWLANDLTVWQEPRVTVGMIMLKWWRENRRDFIKPLS